MKKKALILIMLVSIGNMVVAQSKKEFSSDWISFMQDISIQSDVKKKFKVEASVKVISEDKNAWAGIWVRVDTKNNGKSFFDNMGDRPIKSSKWQSYTVEGTLDSNSETLNFGGLCFYNGQFFFDDFKLYIENNKGDFEEVELLNGGFEGRVKSNFIPKWYMGIQRGKEFTLTSSQDRSEGKSSLLIEGKGIVLKSDGTIGNIEGVSPQIGAMISMLEDLKERVEKQVTNMSQYELDYLHDEKANRIGALIMHLAAAEVYYQVLTFENRGFNEEEKEKWQVALDLDEGGRNEIYGQSAQYYLDIYNEVRAKTIAELKKRDDVWFQEMQPKYGRSNHYCWFHVMEHQSSHLGQILFLKKRIPPEPELELKQKNKY